MSDLRDFSWTEDRDSVVLPEQPETACYTNGNGFVVIRQNGWPDDDDAVVIVDPNNVRKLAAAMFAAAGITDTPTPPRALPRPQAQAEPDTGDLLEGVVNG